MKFIHYYSCICHSKTYRRFFNIPNKDAELTRLSATSIRCKRGESTCTLHRGTKTDIGTTWLTNPAYGWTDFPGVPRVCICTYVCGCACVRSYMHCMCVGTVMLNLVCTRNAFSQRNYLGLSFISML